MADATYINQAVYEKQGGNELVIADGGKLTVESGGETEGQSGGYFDAQTGYAYYFTSSSNEVSAAQMRALLWNQTQFSIIANTAGVLSVTNLPSAGVIIFSLADAASNASAWLTSTGGIPGQIMQLMVRGGGSAASIYISMSGVSLVGTLSGDVSSFSLQTSATSNATIRLLLTDTSEWSIIDKSSGSVVERGA